MAKCQSKPAIWSHWSRSINAKASTLVLQLAHFIHWCVPISVARFGKISPFWQKNKSLWLFFQGYFILGKNLNTLWLIFNGLGHIFLFKDSQLLSNVAIWSHWYQFSKVLKNCCQTSMANLFSNEPFPASFISIVLSTLNGNFNFLPMTGFEPQTSGIGSYLSTEPQPMP